MYLPEIICKFKPELADGQGGNIAITSNALSSKQRTIHLPGGDTVMPGYEITEELVAVALLEKASIKQGMVTPTAPHSTQSSALRSAVCGTTIVSARHQLCTKRNSVMTILGQTGCLWERTGGRRGLC